MKIIIDDRRIKKLRARNIAEPEKFVQKVLEKEPSGIYIFDGGRVKKSYDHPAYTDVLFVIKIFGNQYYARLITDNAKGGGLDGSIWAREFGTRFSNPFTGSTKNRNDVLYRMKMTLLECRKHLHKFEYYDNTIE